LFAVGETAAEIVGETAAEIVGETAAGIVGETAAASIPDTPDGAPPDPGARREPSLSALAQRLAAAGPRTRMRLQDRQGPAPLSEAAPGAVPEAGPRTPKWWLPPEEDQAALADHAPHPPLTAAGYALDHESVYEGEEAGTRWPPEGWPVMLRRVGLLSAAAICGFGVVALGQSAPFGAWLKHLGEPAKPQTVAAAVPEAVASDPVPTPAPAWAPASVPTAHLPARLREAHIQTVRVPAAMSAAHNPSPHVAQPTRAGTLPHAAPAARREPIAQAASLHIVHPEAPFPARLTARASTAPVRPPPPHRPVHYELPRWLTEASLVPPPPPPRPPLLSPKPHNLDAPAPLADGAGHGLIMSPPPHNLDQPAPPPPPAAYSEAAPQRVFVPPPPYMQGGPPGLP
jgi:hypothetical protein